MKCRKYFVKKRAYLTIEGNLGDSDALRLESALILTLAECETMNLNIDNVTSISPYCAKTLTRAIGIARQKEKNLLLDTRYQRDSMLQWIKYIINLPSDQMGLPFTMESNSQVRSNSNH